MMYDSAIKPLVSAAKVQSAAKAPAAQELSSDGSSSENSENSEAEDFPIGATEDLDDETTGAAQGTAIVRDEVKFRLFKDELKTTFNQV